MICYLCGQEIKDVGYFVYGSSSCHMGCGVTKIPFRRSNSSVVSVAQALELARLALATKYRLRTPFREIRMERRIVKNWYIKDTGDGRAYMSGMAIPRDTDGVTRNIDFVSCDFHPASYSTFENCTIDGVRIPDGPGRLYDLQNYRGGGDATEA